MSCVPFKLCWCSHIQLSFSLLCSSRRFTYTSLCTWGWINYHLKSFPPSCAVLKYTWNKPLGIRLFKFEPTRANKPCWTCLPQIFAPQASGGYRDSPINTPLLLTISKYVNKRSLLRSMSQTERIMVSYLSVVPQRTVPMLNTFEPSVLSYWQLLILL